MESIESLRRETSNSNSGGSGSEVVCKECMLAWLRKTTADFHLCVHDEVVVGFKTSAGPISRQRRETPNSNDGGSGAVCKECFLAWLRKTNADFHLCVHDEVVVWFKTSAGPISRPVRNFDKNDQ